MSALVLIALVIAAVVAVAHLVTVVHADQQLSPPRSRRDQHDQFDPRNRLQPRAF